MALLREHFQFGVIAGVPLYMVLFATASYFHLFQDSYILLLSFISGLIAIVAGSLIPDMDSARSPVHDSMLVFFGGLVLGIMQKFSPFYLVLPAASLFSVWVDRNYLPSHRGFIHTVGGGIVLGIFLTGLLYIFVTTSKRFDLWVGFCLVLGHILHLLRDKISDWKRKLETC